LATEAAQQIERKRENNWKTKTLILR